MSKAFYNLEDLYSIPILDVCAALGVHVVKSGRSHFCKIRNEKTASCKLYVKNKDGYDNFYDFGGGFGGNVINFVAAYRGCDWQSAVEYLAESFNIAPVNNTDYITRSELTDIEYSKIGVYGDLATKNFNFLFDRFPIENIQMVSEKYSMSVNQLRKDYPSMYENEIIRKRAIPHVYKLRNDYYFKLYCLISFQKDLTGHFDINNVPRKDFEECKTLCKELEKAEALLKKALKGTDIIYSFKEYNILKDLEGIYLGKISLEIGDKTYYELKRKSLLCGVDLRYRSVDLSEYLSLKEYGIDLVPHAAFLKQEKVNLVFLPDQSEQIDKCINLYHTAKELDSKEQSIDERVSKVVNSEAENEIQVRTDVKKSMDKDER